MKYFELLNCIPPKERMSLTNPVYNISTSAPKLKKRKKNSSRIKLARADIIAELIKLAV